VQHYFTVITLFYNGYRKPFTIVTANHKDFLKDIIAVSVSLYLSYFIQGALKSEVQYFLTSATFGEI